MMYSNKFVAALKSANGKVLREYADTVYIPFGSEYSIYLKNLNIQRALVSITVDGEDIGSDVVINGGQEVTLERFLKDANIGNRFKFIERSGSVEQYRGIKAEDGIIRIEFAYEQPTVYANNPLSGNWLDNTLYRSRGIDRGYNHTLGDAIGSQLSNGDSSGNGVLCSAQYSANNATKISAKGLNLMGNAVPQNEVGITVPGSISEQKFITVPAFKLQAEKYVMVLRLLGETETARVVAPVTVKAKPKCVTCGRVNKANSKFCTNCGTALEII